MEPIVFVLAGLVLLAFAVWALLVVVKTIVEWINRHQSEHRENGGR